MIRTCSAAASEQCNPRRRRLGAVAAAALAAVLCAAAAAAAPAAKAPALLRADGLELSERSLLFALRVRGKEGTARDREREAREHLERLRARLVLAAAAQRRGYAGDPALSASLEEYRLRHLADLLIAEKVERPARERAASDPRRARPERDRLYDELKRRAVEAFPATLDEAALAAAGRGEGGTNAVARVAGHAISADEVRRGMGSVDHPGEKGTTGERLARLVVEIIAADRAIAALAEREGIAARADFADDLNDRRVRFLADLYAERDVYPAVRVAPADLEARYRRDEPRLRRRTEREIFEIVVQDEQTAQAVAARLAAGASFADEVREHSVASSKEAGGRLGLLQEGQTIPELDRAIRALRAGEISAPVRTRFGWHILRCEKVVEGRLPPFEEVRAGLEAEELAARRAAALRERVVALEREIKVEFDERRYQEIVRGQAQ